MLKLLGDEKLADALLFCDNDVFSLWISAGIKVYGTDSRYIRTWYARNAEGKINCLMSMTGETLRASFLPDADFESAAELARLSGAAEFVFDARYEALLGSADRRKGEILLASSLPEYPENAVRLEAQQLKGIYTVVCGHDNEAFGRWYTETSHRVRHGISTVFACSEHGAPVSCAQVLAENSSMGLITDVSTLPACRRRGYAGSCVCKAVDYLRSQGKSAVLLSEDEGSTAFYKHLGFYQAGEWCKCVFLR